jgi:hypothetical protein
MMSCARKLMEVCDEILGIFAAVPPDAFPRTTPGDTEGEREYLMRRISGLRALAVEHMARNEAGPKLNAAYP